MGGNDPRNMIRRALRDFGIEPTKDLVEAIYQDVVRPVESKARNDAMQARIERYILQTPLGVFLKK